MAGFLNQSAILV